MTEYWRQYSGFCCHNIPEYLQSNVPWLQEKNPNLHFPNQFYFVGSYREAEIKIL